MPGDPTPRLARIPTLPLQTAFVGDGGAAGDRYYALQTSDTPAGIPHMQAPYSAVLPSTRDSVTPGAAGDAALSGRVLPGELGELGERIRLASSVDVHYEYQPSSHVLWGQAVRPLSVRPANPWSCVPPASSRKLVKYKIGGRWNALAAAPNGAMKCALVGSDGLFTNAMEGDGSAPPLHQLSSRRLTSAQDMNTVLWRPAYHIATGFANGHVYIWDPSRTSDGIVQKYTDSARRVNSMAYKPDDPRVIYVAHSSGEIVVWDTRTKGRRTTFHTNKATSLHDIDCNQQDANSLAAITHDGTVLTWDVRNPKKETRRIFAHNMSQGHTIAWHPSGRFIASGGNDAFIKIWDLKATSSKKLSPSAYCAIKTVGYIHKLQWRPGHDTQLASCPTSPHTYLTVWDMHNPNHSLMYHNQHSTTITGFTWYDENTVWSVGTREQLIQCDMQSDAILTSGLLPNTVADFSPNTRICVATGEHESRHGRALDWTTSQRFYASDPWPAPGT
ncbi:SEA (Seh1-associated) complex subunit, partial [Coemansia nantahalensis]